jgi:hypothetical protein
MPKTQVVCSVCKNTHTAQITDTQFRGEEGFLFVCPDIDRRYRLANFYVDSRRGFFKSESLIDQQEMVLDNLKAELGRNNFEEKFKRWNQINHPSLGLNEEYSKNLSQIINTYSIGYSYPAVTSACCLAERILNRLVLRCRSHFKSHPKYRKIYQKDSFNDWGLMLELIQDWRLIPPKAIQLFSELMPIRHHSIHYNEDYDFEGIAPDAVNKLIAAITEVFGVINRKDIYLVFDVPGEVWVRSDAEGLPFVREFVISQCYHAHAVHDVDLCERRIVERLGKTGKLSDEEFVELRKLSLDIK